jgi:hypothetical protein
VLKVLCLSDGMMRAVNFAEITLGVHRVSKLRPLG